MNIAVRYYYDSRNITCKYYIYIYYVRTGACVSVISDANRSPTTLSGSQSAAAAAAAESATWLSIATVIIHDIDLHITTSSFTTYYYYTSVIIIIIIIVIRS